MKTTEITPAISEVVIANIDINPSNPRTSFPVAEMHELKASIKEQGVIQPVLVRPIGKRFELVYGERRLKGAQLAGLVTIPAQIRELSDNEALEIAITENLQRADISPLDEAAAYRKLIEERQYDVVSLYHKFGKSETYIRGRMRLNELIPEFVNLFADDIISISVALEISQYNIDLQKDIYIDHFKSEAGYNSWRKLSLKDLSTGIAGQYTAKLSRYNFDKTDCQSCPFNSSIYQLFGNPESSGECSMKSCLQQKNTNYLVEAALECLAQNPLIQFCKSYNTNKEVVDVLVEMGHEIRSVDYPKTYLEMPTAPEHDEVATKKERTEANAEYKRKLKTYKIEQEAFFNLKEQGHIVELIRIGTNALELCYMVASKSEEITDPASMIEKLKAKDKRNKEIAGEKIIEESKVLIRQAAYKGDFSEFEEQLVYYFMLSSLKQSNYEQFGIKQKWSLEYGDRMEILDTLNDEVRAMIRRDFLVANLIGLYGPSQNLILKFAQQHAPEELAAIQKVHVDVYKKRNLRLKERISALEVKIE